MTTHTLRPASYLGTYSATSGGDPDTELADASDATWVDIDTGQVLILEMDDFTIPAGAVVKSAQVRVRGNEPSGVYTGGVPFGVEIWEYISGGTQEQVTYAVMYPGGPATVTCPAATITLPAGYEQSFADAFAVYLRGGYGIVLRAHALWLDVVTAAQPTVNVSWPTGTITTTSNPNVEWTHTPGSDGGPQSRYQVKLFTAAQYGAGGFNPATSTPAYNSGEILGAANVTTVPVSDATTYRAYVRTAQTINGNAHWSDWDYSAFDTDFDAPILEGIAAGPDPERARIVVLVTLASTDWDTITMERSSDGGTTWEFVRGMSAVAAPAADEVAAGYDYEAENGTAYLYRARATYLEFTGEWLATTVAEAWESPTTWLKDPAFPGANVPILMSSAPTLRRTRRMGVHRVTGRRAPVVTADVRQLTEGPLEIATLDDADGDALDELLDSTVLLLQTPPGDRFGSKYLAIAVTDEIRPVDKYGEPARIWSVPFIEVDRPLDSGITIPAADVVAEPLTWDEAASFTWAELVDLFDDWEDVIT